MLEMERNVYKEIHHMIHRKYHTCEARKRSPRITLNPTFPLPIGLFWVFLSTSLHHHGVCHHIQRIVPCMIRPRNPASFGAHTLRLEAFKRNYCGCKDLHFSVGGLRVHQSGKWKLYIICTCIRITSSFKWCSNRRLWRAQKADRQ